MKSFFVIFFAFRVQSYIHNDGCGRKSGGVGLVFGGDQVRKGDWPWLVAFVYWPGEQFFCGGNLISRKHVLSGKVVNSIM